MIWTIIVFVVLLIVLRTVAWKPILRVLNERERFIQQSLADARTEREKAEQLRHSYEEQMVRARQDASKVVEEGRRDGEQVARRIQEAARRDADELLQRAKREIQLATDTARKQLHDEVSDLAVRVARNIVRKELSAADHKALVEESLREMQSAGPRT
jgi:F-type H+-transporting ATPase subunit b